MPYSIDLRKRVIAAVRNGMTKVAICELFNVCKQTLYNWIKLEERQGHLEPITGFQKGHSHGIKDLEAFREFVDLHSDYTHDEMAEHFGVGASTIGRSLQKIGYSRKKRVKRTQKETKQSGKPI
jgi:transposase